MMKNIKHKVELATYVTCPRLRVKYEHIKFKYFETEDQAKWYVSILNIVCKPKKGALVAIYRGEDTE